MADQPIHVELPVRHPSQRRRHVQVPSRPDAIHAPDRFDAGEVLRRTGFRVRHETAAARDDAAGIGRALEKIGAGDFSGSAGNLLVIFLSGLLGLLLLDLLISQRGSTVTSKAVGWLTSALDRVVSPTDPLTSPGAGAPTVSSPSAATAADPALPAGSGAGAGGYVDPVAGATFERVDQGVDLKGKPGQPVLAIGDAQVDAVKADPGGFGTAIYYTLLNGAHAGQQIYVGHAQPTVKPGDQVAAGAPVARLLAKPLGNATEPGWTEIGFAAGGVPANNGNAFNSFLQTLLSPNRKATATATATGP